jgi:hypothetical protein
MILGGRWGAYPLFSSVGVGHRLPRTAVVGCLIVHDGRDVAVCIAVRNRWDNVLVIGTHREHPAGSPFKGPK